jgi:phosphoglycolate phosphatase
VYQSLIFDLDGTVTDSKVGIVRSVNHALKSCGFPEVKQDRDVSWFVGPPIREGFEELVGTSDKSLIEKLVATYRERYATTGVCETVLYPGIAELLSNLFDRKKVLILVTSKPTTYAKKILENFELSCLFDRIIGCELDGTRSSKEELVKFVIDAYGGPTSGYVMIGDRRDDIIGARSNSIDSIGVLYGYGTTSEVTESNPTFVARTVENIRAILLSV